MSITCRTLIHRVHDKSLLLSSIRNATLEREMWECSIVAVCSDPASLTSVECGWGRHDEECGATLATSSVPMPMFLVTGQMRSQPAAGPAHNTSSCEEEEEEDEAGSEEPVRCSPRCPASSNARLPGLGSGDLALVREWVRFVSRAAGSKDRLCTLGSLDERSDDDNPRPSKVQGRDSWQTDCTLARSPHDAASRPSAAPPPHTHAHTQKWQPTPTPALAVCPLPGASLHLAYTAKSLAEEEDTEEQAEGRGKHCIYIDEHPGGNEMPDSGTPRLLVRQALPCPAQPCTSPPCSPRLHHP